MFRNHVEYGGGCWGWTLQGYLIRNGPPLGPYSGALSRVPRLSYWGGSFLMSGVPLYKNENKNGVIYFWRRKLAKRSSCQPLSSKLVAYKTAKARFWPWLSGKSPSTLGPLWEGCRESRRCSRDTDSESWISRYTSIRRLNRSLSVR
jgi:hypothetical protein